MSEDKRLFDPIIGQTEQERFVQVDRNCAGLPPKEYKNWNELETIASQDYEANRNAPEIHESIHGIKAHIEREVQDNTVKHFGIEAARIRRLIVNIETSLERIRNVIADDPDTYKSADKAMVVKLANARLELKRCLGRIAEVRTHYDNKNG